MYILIKWLINALTLIIIAETVSGIEVSGFYIALVVAALWGLVSITIKPVLILLTLPLNIITLGLFTLVINGLLFWFIATFIEGFDVSDFLAAFVGAIIITVVSVITNMTIRQSKNEKSRK